MNLTSLTLSGLLLMAAAVAIAPNAAAYDIRCIGATEPVCDVYHDVAECTPDGGVNLCVQGNRPEGPCATVQLGYTQSVAACADTDPPSVLVCHWAYLLGTFCPVDLP